MRHGACNVKRLVLPDIQVGVIRKGALVNGLNVVV